MWSVHSSVCSSQCLVHSVKWPAQAWWPVTCQPHLAPGVTETSAGPTDSSLLSRSSWVLEVTSTRWGWGECRVEWPSDPCLQVRTDLGWLEAGGPWLWCQDGEADPGGGGVGHCCHWTVRWLRWLDRLPGRDHLHRQEVAAGTPDEAQSLQPASLPGPRREALPPVRLWDIRGLGPLLPLDLWLRGGEDGGWRYVIWPLGLL